MKKWFWLLCALVVLPGLSFSQGIRKNYTEMTEAEQNAYVEALNALYNEDPNLDIVRTFSSDQSSGYYWNYYYNVFQSSCTTRQFLPFHRMLLWEMENALQTKNPRMTIPYWDWRVNNTADDLLFTSFLNIYRLPAAWEISRVMESYGNLPGDYQIQNITESPYFCNDEDPNTSFNDQIEYPLTIQITNWVGGTIDDPRDPIFFLHHAMVDKLWQDWERSAHGSWFDASTLDRYDGTTSGVYIATLPPTNPNNIMDSRTLGVFYANNGVANLDGDYQVQNLYQTPENFSYPGLIVASTFTVPQNTNATFTSAAQVELATGFTVEGHLEIKVGEDYYNDFPLAKRGMGHGPFAQKEQPAFTGLDNIVFARSSNGFIAHLQLENSAEVQGYVMGIDGKIVSRLQAGHLESGRHDLELNVPQGGGLYYGYFRIGDQIYKRLLPRL